MIAPSSFSPGMEEKAEQSLLEFQEAKGDLNLALDAVMAQDVQRLSTRYEEQARAMDKQLAGETTPGEPMGDVLIRSPRTENHYHPPKPSMGTLGKLALGAALLAGGGGAGYLVNNYLNKPVESTTINTTKGFLIELIPPKK